MAPDLLSLIYPAKDNHHIFRNIELQLTTEGGIEYEIKPTFNNLISLFFGLKGALIAETVTHNADNEFNELLTHLDNYKSCDINLIRANIQKSFIRIKQEIMETINGNNHMHDNGMATNTTREELNTHNRMLLERVELFENEILENFSKGV